jgi:pimeloyl-ACP methyl ester carboxylesterase
VAADTISELLNEIGPAIIIAHSAGGGATFMVPDRNAANVVGIIAFEAAGGQPLTPGFGGTPPALAGWETTPPLPADFEPVMTDGCPMQGDNPSQLDNYAGIPVVLVASEMGLGIFGETDGRRGIECQAAAWRQAGVDASSVYFPDRGLSGGGHFAMAQLDSVAYVREFIRLATQIEVSSDR